MSRWDDLFAWREHWLGRPVIADDFSVEKLPYGDIHYGYAELVTKFRKLRTDARERAVRSYYAAKGVMNCPFCGASPSSDGRKRALLVCWDCGARGPTTQISRHGMLVSPKGAWNRVSQIVKDRSDQDEVDLARLRRVIGVGPTRSLQLGCSVLKCWRRSTPWNWWVENKKGKQLWHSSEERGRVIPNTRMFNVAEHSSVLVGDGLPAMAGMLISLREMSSPELSIYELKPEFRVS